MSLINDALRRAKEAQEHAPPPPAPEPQLRPVDSQTLVTRGIGIALPFALAVFALLGLFLAWRFYQAHDGRSPGEVVAKAREATPPARIDQNPAVLADASAGKSHRVGPWHHSCRATER
jgi:hypothetical protein